MDARVRIALAAVLGTVLLAGVVAAEGGDGGGLVELIRGLIEALQAILDTIGGEA